MDPAGSDQQVHAVIFEDEVADLAELDSKLGTARAMLGIAVFALAAGIVKNGKQTHHFDIRSMMTCEMEAVAEDRQPVPGTVNRIAPKPELGGDELPERDFDMCQHGGRKMLREMGDRYKVEAGGVSILESVREFLDQIGYLSVLQ